MNLPSIVCGRYSHISCAFLRLRSICFQYLPAEYRDTASQLPGHVSRRFIMNGTAGTRFFLLYSTLFLIRTVLYYGRTDLLLSLVAARKVTVI